MTKAPPKGRPRQQCVGNLDQTEGPNLIALREQFVRRDLDPAGGELVDLEALLNGPVALTVGRDGQTKGQTLRHTVVTSTCLLYTSPSPRD